MATNTQNENLGAAERLIQALLTHTDHLYHNRPGVVVADGRTVTGVRWSPVTHKVEGDEKVVYRLDKVGKKTNKVRIGVLGEDKVVREDGRRVGEYREAGLFPEVAEWMWKQIAEIWGYDNEFSARWASYAFGQEHRDIKTALAAFMLVQSRKGDPVVDEGEAFRDEDYRSVGEAMILLRRDGKDLNPKQLLRVHELLTLPAIAKINRELGFGISPRNPFLGRWEQAVEQWLLYREQNPRMLDGLIKSGYRKTVIKLARLAHYKPESPKFFATLRWKQHQAKDGRRSIAIGVEVDAAESWEDLSEEQVCQKIVEDRPDWKRIVGLLPKDVGVTRAVMAAAIESGCLSDKDLIIATPTLEELGLLNVQDVKDRWQAATQRAEDQRAANIAKNVRSKEAKEKLEEAADTAVQKAVEEVAKDIRIYCMVDISGSMEVAIEAAKKHLTKLLPGFPLEKLHVSVFNTAGRELKIQRASSAGVTNAFRGIAARGGTDYGAGVRALQKYRPSEDEDVLFLFFGDELAYDFDAAVRASELNPMAFGFVKVEDPRYTNHPQLRGLKAVTNTARALGIPCFMIEEDTFADPYAIPRTIRALVASTPVQQGRQVARRPRKTLVETILETELLQKPAWAA